MSSIKASLILIAVIINTVMCCTPLILFSLCKLLSPNIIRKQISKVLIFIAESWISINSWLMDTFVNVQWKYSGDLELLSKDAWYLVISNHQSWVDILLLQRTFNRRIPFLKFFLKQELIWVPLLGLAWWALDFPFMKRHSAKTIAKKPHLRGQDLETTRIACQKYKHDPVSVMNFIEGTRYTPEKHRSQKTPYKNLLKPRAGGISFVIDAMGDIMSGLVNVTIKYQDGAPTFWSFLKCYQPTIHIHISLQDLPTKSSNAETPAAGRKEFRNWLDSVWEEKDKKLEEL